MNKISKNEKGFTLFEGLLIVLFSVVIGVLGYMVYNNHLKAPTAVITRTSNKPVKNPPGEIINGTAIMSTNAGEGISLQYTQTVGGQTYKPFEPLQNEIDTTTKITNEAGNTIQFKNIEVGDNLKADIYHGPCVSAAVGSTGGCIKRIYYIQDLSR